MLHENSIESRASLVNCLFLCKYLIKSTFDNPESNQNFHVLTNQIYYWTCVMKFAKSFSVSRLDIWVTNSFPLYAYWTPSPLQCDHRWFKSVRVRTVNHFFDNRLPNRLRLRPASNGFCAIIWLRRLASRERNRNVNNIWRSTWMIHRTTLLFLFFFRLEKLIKVARKLKVDAASRAIKRQGQMKGGRERGRERKVRALSTSKNGKSGKDFAS